MLTSSGLFLFAGLVFVQVGVESLYGENVADIVLGLVLLLVALICYLHYRKYDA